jgi:hypothetical protein
MTFSNAPLPFDPERGQSLEHAPSEAAWQPGTFHQYSVVVPMPNSPVLQAITLIATVSLAFIGYIITYLNNLRLENTKARVKFISDQVQNLYGPL